MAWRKALHRLKIGLVLLGTVLVLGFVSTLVPWKPLGTWFASLSYLAVAGLIGGACVIFGLLTLTPTLARRYWAGHVSGWWYAVGLIVVPIVATTAAALWVLLAAVDTPQASDRIDVIRTALTIGGGTGGVVALVLAGRRQWRSEVSAHSSEHDATERRITDLYTKAADQLGSAKAPVRLAGLYALERLAQNNRDLRQTVVNVMCAYLRMPYSSSTSEDSNESAATRSDALAEQEQERQVRLAAQRIISDHLRPGLQQSFWPGIDLDLNGATLHDFYLFECVAGKVRFDNARFVGGATFRKTTFVYDAWFDGASFQSRPTFEGASFLDDVTFEYAVFERGAEFSEVTFYKRADFSRIQLDRDLDFYGAEAAADADHRWPSGWVLRAPTEPQSRRRRLSAKQLNLGRLERN
jgi:hypothetical protein